MERIDRIFLTFVTDYRDRWPSHIDSNWRMKVEGRRRARYPPRGHEMELVDGGDADWTQKLLNNTKNVSS